MKLSEAIRAGCKLKPHQGIGSQSLDTSEDNVCVLGAAGCGAGLELDQYTGYSVLRKQWPILCEPVKNPPACVGPYHHGERLDRIMYILNDTYHWSRENIADWIETIEAEVEECGLKDGGSSV